MKRILIFLFCALFAFSCASSKASSGGNTEGQALEETKAAAEDAVKRVHELETEKAKLEAKKAGK